MLGLILVLVFAKYYVLLKENILEIGLFVLPSGGQDQGGVF